MSVEYFKKGTVIMYKEALRPAWVEINLSNADYNIKQIIEKIGPDREVIGVIKGDAYGHGIVKMAEVLRKNGVRTLAVATLSEAIMLREAGAMEEIIILSLVPDMYVDKIIKYNITPVVNSYENAKAISDAAESHGTAVGGLIAIDTGMGRIGYLLETDEEIDMAADEVEKISRLDNFEVKGLFSHLATADMEDKEFVKQQERKFADFADCLDKRGIHLAMKTLANSAAVLDEESAYHDCVRPGILLYGCYPSKEVNRSAIKLKPVMSVKANIVHIKKVPAGFSIGYGRRFIAQRDSVIGTIGMGYADGLPRPYSEAGRVIVNGRFAPFAGTICMDQFMVDLTDVPDVKLGDEVVIMGESGDLSITAEEIADATNTINYEVLCAFGQRLPKVYVR